MAMRYVAWLILLAAVPALVWAQEPTVTDAIDVPAEEQATAPGLQSPPEEFYRGEVEEIVRERQDEIGLSGTKPFLQTVRVKFLEGPREGETEVLEYGVLLAEQKLTAGQQIILVTLQDRVYIFDRYRLPALGSILVLFAGLAMIFAGWRGITSLIGLGVSVLVLTLYVVPQIMAGTSPLLVSLVGALVIALVSIYLAHGFNRRTTVALISTLLTVVVAMGLAYGFVEWADLTGSGSEESYYLQTSPIAFVNLKGLLLGGIIIGALGVLDDITTAQAAAVYEIWRANPALSRRELFKRGKAVGREHITSLINTLALAYVGASFPALLLFTVYRRPWWVVLNTETMTEEVVRTLVGSASLMLAVPITTFLAAYWFSRTTHPPEAISLAAPPSHSH